MAVERTTAYGAWCDRDPEGVCDFLGPWASEQEAEQGLREHHESEHPEPKPEPESHWAVIRAGAIVVAQGQCWCDGTGKHAIGVRPKPSVSEAERG